MWKLAGGSYVIDAEEGDWKREGTWSYRSPISGETGARLLTQTIHRFAPGFSPGMRNPTSEEVFYVLAGRGRFFIDGFPYPVGAGTGVRAPAGVEYCVENQRKEELAAVSVTCPQEKDRRSGLSPLTRPRTTGTPPALTVQESEQESIPVDDRSFRVLVDPKLGCRQITQFIGCIPPSKAPPHFHTYEEAIFILEGEGVMWTGEEHAPVRPGSSVYLPPEVRHCMENRSSGTLRLLGVFYPAGSPDDRHKD